jgi:purine-binding chemotaxis protein CheW
MKKILDFSVLKNSEEKTNYGIEAEKVIEITKEPVNITYIPKAPGYINGIFKLRNKIIYIIDIEKILSESNQRNNPNSEKYNGQKYIVMTELNGANIGLLVHKINAIRNVDEKDILNPKTIIQERIPLSGIVKIENDNLLFLLELDEILSLNKK